jgi:DNA repair protein RecO (recombination protein O)
VTGAAQPGQPAIVLRATAYGEADRVVSLLTRDHGKLSAIARGARKSVRRFGGGLGLGATGAATLRDRPGAELAGLEGFDVTKPRGALATDVARTAHAAYALELVDKLSPPRQPEPGVFDWLDELLDRLETGPPTAERLRVYELGLLERLGLAPLLDACVACGRTELGDETVRHQPERGGIVCATCATRGRPMGGDVRRALLRLQAATLADADAIRLDPAVNLACREAVAEALAEHLPGPLKSLEFIAKLTGK